MSQIDSIELKLDRGAGRFVKIERELAELRGAVEVLKSHTSWTLVAALLAFLGSMVVAWAILSAGSA